MLYKSLPKCTKGSQAYLDEMSDPPPPAHRKPRPLPFPILSSTPKGARNPFNPRQSRHPLLEKLRRPITKSTDPPSSGSAYRTSPPSTTIVSSLTDKAWDSFKDRDHPWCLPFGMSDCLECRARMCLLDNTENSTRAVTSPPALYRISKIFRRNSAFNASSATESFLPANCQDCCDDESDSESEWSLATTDNNIGAGRTVDRYFYKPAGLWVEKKLNRVLGPYLLSPYVLSHQLSQALRRIIPVNLKKRRPFIGRINIAYIEKHLHKHEFLAFRRLLHDAL